MKSNPRSVYELFDGERRYVVPLYQRQYVWGRENQWEPLWEDVLAKAVARLDSHESSPHFMGAMVLDQLRTFGNQIPAHTVIDGQQRLTTLQILLSAFRDVASGRGFQEYADQMSRYVKNSGLMEDKEVEKYKVWPTKADQKQFCDVISAQSNEALEQVYPAVYVRRRLQPRPAMVEAYLYFRDVLESFLDDPDYAATAEARVKALYQALKGDLQVVTIELEGNDDPQVIFETLNARGEPLLPSDLLRNSIFRRAGQKKEDQDALYETYWKRFEEDFWRVEEKQGRLKRARIDLFMQHFLALKKAADVNVSHMFEEYKNWIKQGDPYPSVEDELKDLGRYAESFTRLIEPDVATRFGKFASRLKVLDVRTIYPLALYVLADSNLPQEETEGIFLDLESYLVRRAVCGKTTKNYNKLFLQTLRDLKDMGVSREAVRGRLLAFTGDAGVWPDDREFGKAWLTRGVYDYLGPAKVEAILHAIEDELRHQHNEEITIHSPLTVEHVMPQSWEDTWPLPPDRLEGPDAEAAAAERDVLIHTFGNLTLLTQPLNSSLSNSPYPQKRPEITSQSYLRLNAYFQGVDEWDESKIRERGEALFTVAKKLWPYPPAPAALG